MLFDNEYKIPNAFWKYYDLYRRNEITLKTFSEKSGLSKEFILLYLKMI